MSPRKLKPGDFGYREEDGSMRIMPGWVMDASGYVRREGAKPDPKPKPKGKKK